MNKNQIIIKSTLNNANYYGKKFEEKTNNEGRLIEKGYKKIIMSKNKCGYYLSKHIGEQIIIFVSQSGLKEYIKQNKGQIKTSYEVNKINYDIDNLHK